MTEVLRSKKLDQMSADYINGGEPTKEEVVEVYEELTKLDKTGKLDPNHAMFLHLLGSEEEFRKDLEDPDMIGSVCSVLNIF